MPSPAFGPELARPWFSPHFFCNSMPQSSADLPPANRSGLLNELFLLGPEAQGDIDESILWENLARTPAQRLIEASRAATQIENLKEAMRARKRG